MPGLRVPPVRVRGAPGQCERWQAAAHGQGTGNGGEACEGEARGEEAARGGGAGGGAGREEEEEHGGRGRGRGPGGHGGPAGGPDMRAVPQRGAREADAAVRPMQPRMASILPVAAAVGHPSWELVLPGVPGVGERQLRVRAGEGVLVRVVPAVCGAVQAEVVRRSDESSEQLRRGGGLLAHRGEGDGPGGGAVWERHRYGSLRQRVPASVGPCAAWGGAGGMAEVRDEPLEPEQLPEAGGFDVADGAGRHPGRDRAVALHGDAVFVVLLALRGPLLLLDQLLAQVCGMGGGGSWSPWVAMVCLGFRGPASARSRVLSCRPAFSLFEVGRRPSITSDARSFPCELSRSTDGVVSVVSRCRVLSVESCVG